MRLYITDTITQQEEDAVFQGLEEYNFERIEERRQVDLGVILHGDDGKICAGIIAKTRGNWLMVKYLWVSQELRGKNIGSQILQQAEEEAKKRGCQCAFLDTFGFQAPEFYQKHGYQEAFVLENFPITGKRHYFIKVFEQG